MRVIKHAMLSLIRKPTKAIMIFCVLVLVFGLVFTGIIIQNSVKESKEYVRKELGATVQVTPDWMQARIDDVDDYSVLQPDATIADEIAKDNRVKKTYLVKYSYGEVKGLKSGRKLTEGETDNSMDYPDDYEPSLYLDMFGTSQGKPIEFEVGTLQLEEGEFITDEQITNGDKVALISVELASANNLSVGDTFKALNERARYDVYTFDDGSTTATATEDSDLNEDSYTEEFTIVGIYSGASNEVTDRIFTTLDASKIFSWNEEEMEVIDSIYLLLDDPLEVESFIEDNNDKLPNKYMTLTANDDEFEQLTQPLDLMEVITSLMIWVVFGAGAMIVLAIVTIFVRDRKFEIGLLLASGESRIKIIQQFLLEIVIVALLAFIVAGGVSQLSSSYVAKWIVDNQLTSEENDKYDQMRGEYIWDQTTNVVTFSDVADEFNVALEFDVVLNLLLITFGILLFAASIPLIVIMSYKPREALQD